MQNEGLISENERNSCGKWRILFVKWNQHYKKIKGILKEYGGLLRENKGLVSENEKNSSVNWRICSVKWNQFYKKIKGILEENAGFVIQKWKEILVKMKVFHRILTPWVLTRLTWGASE